MSKDIIAKAQSWENIIYNVYRLKNNIIQSM